MRFLCFAFVLLFVGELYAQQRTFSLRGSVVDSESKEPIYYMQMALFKPNAQVPVAFSETNEKGEFNLSAEAGVYTLEAMLIGYERRKIEVELRGNVDLGRIELKSESEHLEEVVIQAARFPIKADLEGLTIQPDQNLSNVGGTLLDILRNTPSVSVSDDGSISLRGSSGTNILINGRNSSLTQNLDQLPASAVQQIKIINNPNARFDADAEGGVIDIILKKGEDMGTNGNAEFTYGTRGRMNTGLRLNHRTLNYNVYGGYNFRRWRDVGFRELERRLFEDDELLKQRTDQQFQNLGHTFNYGGDYYFGKNIISYEGVFTTNVDSQVNNLSSRLSRYASGESVMDYVRRNDESEDDDGVDNALIYERTFDDPGKEFKFLASHSYRSQYKTQHIDIFNHATEALPENLTNQERAAIDEKRHIYVFQMDYANQISEKSKIEMGLKSILRDFDYDYLYERYSESMQEFEEDLDVSNRFLYKDNIHAGYFIYSSQAGKTGFSAGVRGEYTYINTNLLNTNDENTQRYFNLFPSAQVLHELNESHSLKFTYSRRIDRPQPWRLNPFPDITDSLTVRRGNPNLQPEKIHSVEVGHLWNKGSVSFTSNMFYRHVSGQLDMITIIRDGISYIQPENLNTAVSYGFEVIGIGELNSWWNISGGLTAFRIAVDGTNLPNGVINKGYAWNTKLTSDFKLPLGINFQIVANYDSPEIEAQGRDRSVYFMDTNLMKRILSDKGSIALSVRDVFDTRRFAGENRTIAFAQDFYSKRETRIILVSARYSF